jgi:hypothetical protein
MPHPSEADSQNAPPEDDLPRDALGEDVLETDFPPNRKAFLVEPLLVDVNTNKVQPLMGDIATQPTFMVQPLYVDPLMTNMVQPEAKEDSIMEMAPHTQDFHLTELSERALTDGSTYSGQWLGGLPHGDGLMSWPNGTKYHGEFRDGKATGTGSCSLADGSKYVGPWVDDYPHGSMGFSCLASGEFYSGEFFNGNQHGMGHLTLPDRSTFVGQFRNGLKSGRICAVYRSFF